MKVAFFASTENGMCSGFIGLDERLDGIDLTTVDWHEYGFYFEEGEHLIDIVECRTFNDAKRHQNMLRGWDIEEGCDAWGDEVLK